MESHPNCRCTSTAITKSWEELGAEFGFDFSAAEKAGPSFAEVADKYGVTPEQRRAYANRKGSGEAYFKNLDPVEQQSVLGKTRWQAWSTGKLSFDNMIQKTSNPVWGVTQKLSSLSSLGLEENKLFEEFKRDQSKTVHNAAVESIKINKVKGGSSVSLIYGDMAGKPYYSVSIFPECGLSIPGKEIDEEGLQSYIREHMDLLNRRNIVIGTWYNERDGRTYIDISAIISDENFAIELGKRYNQIAIFNLEDAREVFTGGTGENISSLPSIEKRLKELKYGNPIN